METLLISIIIPSFNRDELIKTTLNSVLEQSYVHWECIVVDDGSTDNTLLVLETYTKQDPRITYFERKREPKGASTCRNIGLEHAKGDYVIYLDSDDYLLPFCLKQRIDAINSNKDCDFLVFPMGEQKGKTVVKVEIPNSDDYLVNFLSAVLPWSIMCPIWEITFLKELQGFTEGYPRFNDPELMIRALLNPDVDFKVFQNAKYDTVYIPSPKVKTVFNDKVFKSLCVFIPDIMKHLERNDKETLKKYLAFYLHLWFKYIYISSESKKYKPSLVLINLFKNCHIISHSKASSLKLRLFIYVFSSYFLNKPIDKLTDKSLYY